MSNRLWLIALLLGTSIAFARDFNEHKKSEPTPILPNLIQESESVTVLNEKSVQNEKDDTRHTYALQFSAMSAAKLNVFANDSTVVYRRHNHLPAVGFQYGFMPISYRGFWGVLASINYTYLENRDEFSPTALHWVSGDISLAYRMEENRNALIKPYVGVGMISNIVIERGDHDHNTSEARQGADALIGAGLNLHRVFAFDSPLLWELQLEYKRVVSGRSPTLDFNGDHITLGMEMAL